MASATSDTSEQDSPNQSEQNSTTNSDVHDKGLCAPDQEPARNESVKMDESGEEKRTTCNESEEPRSNDKVPSQDAGEAKEMDTGGDVSNQECASSGECSADVTGELKQEQREENVSSLPESSATSKVEDGAEKNSREIKRRASVEMSSSDGEPLSRMDSEDRLVRVDVSAW